MGVFIVYVVIVMCFPIFKELLSTVYGATRIGSFVSVSTVKYTIGKAL